MLTQRIEGSRAEIFIIKVCKEADINADEMIALAKEQSGYDAVNQDYDRGKYLEFILVCRHAIVRWIQKSLVRNDVSIMNLR